MRYGPGARVKGLRGFSIENGQSSAPAAAPAATAPRGRVGARTGDEANAGRRQLVAQ